MIPVHQFLRHQQFDWILPRLTAVFIFKCVIFIIIESRNRWKTEANKKSIPSCKFSGGMTHERGGKRYSQKYFSHSHQHLDSNLADMPNRSKNPKKKKANNLEQFTKRFFPPKENGRYIYTTSIFIICLFSLSFCIVCLSLFLVGRIFQVVAYFKSK